MPRMTGRATRIDTYSYATMEVVPASTPLLDRIATKFTVGDGCWQWTAAQDGRGYGQVARGGRTGMGKAHRVVYELLVGPVPDGLVLDHLCRNTLCVRPSHLEPVPQGENIRRGSQGVASNPHCKNGHEYTPETTGRNKGDGSRYCRICDRARRRARHAQERAKRAMVTYD